MLIYNKTPFLLILLISTLLFSNSCIKKECSENNTFDFKVNISDARKIVYLSSFQNKTGNDLKEVTFYGTDNTDHIFTVKNQDDYILSYIVYLIDNTDTSFVGMKNIYFKDKNYKTCKTYELNL